GITPKEPLPGLDLAKLAAGGGKSDRTTLFGATFDHDVADIDRPEASLQFRWCREGNWKLILPNSSEPSELYDVISDPHETKNLREIHPQIVAKLTQKIDGWWHVSR
ncbi:MAG: sulfatase, partial [Candidatus Saccharimonas sp.]|nr:sulfatase [Planctomycetaceae bacterium]